MTVESVTYISDFNTANPSAGDFKSEGDDHIRNIKIGVKGSFPNLVGAASPGSMGTSLGLVGTPAYSFTGDADTGMWSPAANTLAWSTAGAEVARFDSGGNFGVGATPTYRIHAKQSLSNAVIAATSTDASGVTTFLQANSSTDGRVGTFSNSPFVLSANSSPWMVLTADGRFYGLALHNNAGAVTGAVNQYVASGTYTPTLTNGANIASSSVSNGAWQWTRVGNVVTVSGNLRITCTAAASTGSAIDFTVPIASTFAASGNASGTGTSVTTGPDTGGILWSSGSTVQMQFFATFTGQHNYTLSFTYVVL